MTSTGKPAVPPSSSAREQDVMDFLRANPAFLDRHPDLLRHLTIPHPSGEAVSLLERQVNLLREDNARQKRQLEELIRHARDNENLNRKIQALVLALVNAVGPQAIFASLERALTEDFAADRVKSFVFAEAAFVDAADLDQFVGPAAMQRAAFEAVLAAGRPACGPLSVAQASAVHGTERPGSAAIMPLAGRGWQGVLVIASDDPARYAPDMGTELLGYLTEIVTFVLDPWVKRARAP